MFLLLYTKPKLVFGFQSLSSRTRLLWRDLYPNYIRWFLNHKNSLPAVLLVGSFRNDNF